MFVHRLVLFVSLLLNCVLLYSFMWGNSGVFAYKELKNHSQKLQEQMQELDAQNIALSQEIRLLQSDEKYLEKVIRNRLHYVKDSEILYIFDKEESDLPGVSIDETKN